MSGTFLGCPIVDSAIPEHLRDQLYYLTTNPVIKPQVRTKGITAGERGRCYWNASAIAQSFGGEVIYGWMLYKFQINDGTFIRAYGHGCWLTPEGKVVDVTNHMRTDCDTRDFLGFLPLTETKLVLNAKSYQHVKDFYWCTNREHVYYSIHCALVDMMLDKDGEDQQFDLRVQAEVDLFLNLYGGVLIEVDGVPPSLARVVAGAMQVPYETFFNVVKPSVRLVSSKTTFIRSKDRSFDLNKALHRCFKKGLNLFDSYPDVDPIVPIEMNADPQRYKDTVIGDVGGDLTWQVASQFADETNFPNPSLKGKHKGMMLENIPPNEKFLNELPLPTKKSQKKQLQQIADSYGLTIQEANLLSHPHHFPHPYLVNKAGQKVRRLKDHMKLVSCAGSGKGRGFA